MGYSSNKRFSPLTDSIGLPIDGCGDTYEKKYYVNGTYIDLCGLSIEDYMSNPCCGGNGGSDVVTKPVNEIIVKSFEENGIVYYQAYAKFAVTSNIKITVASAHGAVTVLDLYAGQIKSEPERGETLAFTSVVLDVEEDENYKYISSDGTHTTYDVYVATLHTKDLNELDAADIQTFQKTNMEADTTIDINYVIPGTDFNYNLVEDIAEFEKFCAENQHCFALVLPKDVYDKKMYSITNYGGSDVTKLFVKEGGEFNVDDNTVVCLVEKATDDITPFVPLYQEDLSYSYKLTLNN